MNSQLFCIVDSCGCLCVLKWANFLHSPKPKVKRFTTAKAPQNATINVEELMSPSEDENENEEEEDEWRPLKNEKGRRVSKKTKATGVSSEAPCWPYTTTCSAQI